MEYAIGDVLAWDSLHASATTEVFTLIEILHVVPCDAFGYRLGYILESNYAPHGRRIYSKQHLQQMVVLRRHRVSEN
jgi:hypothetical protein